MERIRVDAKVISLSEINDIYMTLSMVILTDAVNLNKVKFTKEFIEDIIKNKDKYIAIPLVAERDKLEEGNYKNLTHKFKNGEFGTEMIGSFIDFSSRVNDEGITELLGEARVLKRYPAVCEAIKDLYADGNLKFSCEVLVGKSVKKDGYKEVSKDEDNNLIGDCIVSSPAEVRSKATLLIAEALHKDFNLGGEKMKTYVDFFESTALVEIAELDSDQIRIKLFNKLYETLQDDIWEYSGKEIGRDYIILLKYADGDYYRMDYSVTENDVNLSEMYKVTKEYKRAENGEKEDEVMIEELQKQLEEKETEISTLKNDIASKDVLISELNAKISEKDNSIETLNSNIISLGESITSKDAIIAELTPFKDKVDEMEAEKALAEKESKKASLKEKCLKFMSEDEITTEEMSKAIDELDEVFINAKLVEKVLFKAESEKLEEKKEDKKPIITRITDNVIIEGKDGLVGKYITINN